MQSETLDQIKALRDAADEVAAFHEHFAKAYADRQHYDKQGYGFSKDDRFRSFTIRTGFDSKVGVYGSSGCSTVLRVNDEVVAPYFVAALNVHQRELFATAARLMREKAAELRGQAEAELAALQKMLDDTRPVEPAKAA